MRRTLGLLALGGLVAVAVAQVGSGNLLTNFAKLLKDANTMSSTYTVQVIGSAPEEYSVSLKKPNLFRIDTPKELIVADGKEIITLDKATNSYFKEPQSPKRIENLFASDELRLFGGFFVEDAYKAASVKSLGKKNRKGQSATALQANLDASGKKQMTYYIGDDNIARAVQFDLNDPTGKMTYIVDTKTFDVNGDLKQDAFAFTAPQGAQEVSLEDMNSDRWLTSLEEAQQIAARTNKMILVDFYADW